MGLELNTRQKEAVEHFGTPLMIVAGPGSGKTRVIVERVEYLIKTRKLPAETILCLTFSDEAARQMSDRLDKLVDISGMQIGTFHSFCLGILKDNILESGVGFSSEPISKANQLVWGLKNIDSFGFEYTTIGNNGIKIIESMIEGISAFMDELVSPKELANYLAEERKKNPGEEEAEEINKISDLLKVYEKYEEYKRKESLIDFDDMIHLAISLFRKKPSILTKCQKSFKEVLVDEFQDTNYAQLELIKLLCPSGNVTVVGDDDQSIYRFRGAYLTNFEDFKKFYPSHRQIILDQNYRSSKRIVDVSRELIDVAPNRVKKTLSATNSGGSVVAAKCENEDAEVEFVVKEIQELVKNKVNYKDIAILSRKKTEGLKFAKALKGHGIPCAISSESNVFSSPIIRDLMAYLRVANNPVNQGIDITRILKINGIDEQNIARVNKYAKDKMWKDREAPTDFVFEALCEAEKIEAIPISQKRQLKEICNQIKTLSKLEGEYSVSEFVFRLIMSHTDLYKRTLSPDSPENRKKRLVLNEFHKIAQEFSSRSKNLRLLDFLEYLSLMSGFEIELKEGIEVSDSVRIETIHQSKGKEYEAVFVADVATNRLPIKYQSKRFFVPDKLSKGLKIVADEKALSLEEERRLLYVAMTRAKTKLCLAFAERYGDNVNKTKPSKFLEELRYEINPNIELIEFKMEKSSEAIQAETPLEQIKHNLQSQAIMAINQMHTQTAIQKIVDLAKIRHFEENGNLASFNPQELLSLVVITSGIEEAMEGKTLPLVDKDKISFSPSKIQCYEDCPLKFKFQYILNVPSQPKTFFDLGTSVHSVIEQLTKLEIEGTKPTKDIALKLLDANWKTNAYQTKKHESEEKDKAKIMIDSYLAWSGANPNKPIACEKSFEIALNGIKTSGKIDRVEITPEGEYFVIDFKTGAAKENSKTIPENIQLNAYALAAKKLYGKLPKVAALYYLKDNKTVNYSVTSGQVEAVERKLTEDIKSILAEKFEAIPKFMNCKYCDYSCLCEEKEREE